MTVIGVTGGIGTGKSTVSRMFGQLGAKVLDADRVTHELMRPGTVVWKRVRSLFGEGVFSSSGEIDRRRLGGIVFKDRKKLEQLSRIVHPAVRRRFREGMAQIRREDPRSVVVLDVPLLIEAGSTYKVNVLVVVSAPMRTAAERIKARSGWSWREFKKRSSFQLPLREKERVADFVVKNGGSQAATRRQVVRIWNHVCRGES